ncbi:hypothetical protein MVEG_03662 [Podila verticillata NRRL 6337]|nr:hypothetical protein MVEG_03662 [Podila verticillata NRRL 6337]
MPPVRRPPVRRIALVICFLSVCFLALVRMPSKSMLHGMLENPQDVERLMMERYAHSLQFKGKVRIKSLASDYNNDDDVELLPRRLTKKERETTVYYPPACKNGRRHWQICEKVVPSFIIAGAEHSAADVLYETLRTHPQVWDLAKSNAVYERTGNASLDVPDNGTPFFGSQSYNDVDPATKNLEMYLQQFPSIKDIPIIHTRPSGEALPHIQYGMGQFNMAPKSPNSRILVGEIAPSYIHMDGASKRISSTMPEMKAVFIFRDPIERAYLNYLAQRQYAAGFMFEEIVAEELLILKECISRPGSKRWTEFLTCHSEEASKTAKRMGLPNRPRASNSRDTSTPLLDLVVKGLYYSQLNEFVKDVPFPKVLVLRTEDLYDKKSTVSTMARLSQFLNIDSSPFMNFPIEIGADPMSLLREMNDNIVLDEGEMLESASNDSDLDENRRSHHPLDQATRTRLQRVFEPFNQKLVDMFEHRQDFPGWDY